MKIVDQRFVGFLLLVYGCEVFFDASHTCVTTLLTVIYLIHRVYESNKAERLELAKIINTTELRRGKDGCYYTFEVVPWRDPPANYKFITSFFITVLKQDENRKTPPKALRCGFIFVKDPSAIKGVLRYACEGSDFPEDTHKILAE